MSEDMPDRMPEDMPNRMPEGMPNRMPEDLPVTKCINVMVGITRSKVCFLKKQSVSVNIRYMKHWGYQTTWQNHAGAPPETSILNMILRVMCAFRHFSTTHV